MPAPSSGCSSRSTTGRRWQRFQHNLPVVPINDIKVHRKDLVIATQGRGFWILGQPDAAARSKPGPDPGHGRVAAAPRAFPRTYSRHATPIVCAMPEDADDSARPRPNFRAAGAQIDYWLPATHTGEVKLEIRDAAGRLVRAFSSETPQRAQAEGPRDPDDDMRPGGGGGAPRLTKHPGLNRFTWDLRYPGPWSAAARGPAGQGPVAVPGTYTASVIVGNFVVQTPVVVRIDPRSARDGVTLVELREQFEVSMRARDMVSEVNQLVAQVRETKARLKDASGAAADTVRMLTELEQKLVTPPIRYSKPELQAHIQYLYSVTTQADQKLGRDVLDRYATLRRELNELKSSKHGVAARAQ